MLLTALSISNLVAGGTQTPFQTGTSAIGSVKPMVVSGPAASYPSGCVFVSRFYKESAKERERGGEKKKSETKKERT